MSARGRLAKAERKLVRLRALRPGISQDPAARQEFIDLAEDCLIALRSVPDHRLEDANTKFGLGIPLDTPLYDRTFEKAAANSEGAIGYYRWHVDQKRQLETSATFGIPLDRRDLAVHRQDTHLQAQLVTTGQLQFSGKLTLRHQGVTSGAPDTRTESSAVDQSGAAPTRSWWSFPEIPQRDVLDVLEELFRRMTRFVEESDKRLESGQGPA